MPPDQMSTHENDTPTCDNQDIFSVAGIRNQVSLVG